jgi:hypothetical protein
MEWSPVYHVKGWGKFNRHYGDFCTGADNIGNHHSQSTDLVKKLCVLREQDTAQ